MNTLKQEKGFCQTTIKPWLWVLAVLICLTIIWTIWGGKQNFNWRDNRDDLDIENPWGKTTMSAGPQLVLMPLPLGAARTITPPHGDRGRCHNCHPASGTRTLPSMGNSQLAGLRTSPPSGAVLDMQEAFADAATRVRSAVVNISVTKGVRQTAPSMRFANPAGELLNAPGAWNPQPLQTAAQLPQAGGLPPQFNSLCPTTYGQVCPVHGQMCPNNPLCSPSYGQACPVHGQMCPKLRQAVPQMPQYAPQVPQAQPQQIQQPLISSGLGSGIIVDDRGYILTNYHVVAGATSIVVSVPGVKGVQYVGQVVRTDVETDLALVKLLVDAEFPTAPLGNSNTIQVGDFVLAIGSPFGLEQTVTSGIISDTDRTLNIEGRTYIDLIQTDAFINRGNSGGPLVNISGEVIGINTAIYSPTEGFSGVGFAIPINHAREILRGVTEAPEAAQARAILAAQMAQLAAAGPEVSWLGIDAQTVDETIGKQFKVPNKKGVLVNNVLANSPASLAGVQRGDVIIVCDNKRLSDVAQLRSILTNKKVGDAIGLQLIRNGKRKRLNIALAVRPNNLPTPAPTTNEIEAEWRGMDIESLTPEIRKELRIPKTSTGAMVVTEVEGAAGLAGIQVGDIIKSVNGQPINMPSDFFSVVDKTDLLQGVLLDISRKGTPMYITIN